MVHRSFRLIGKYALLLSLLYGLETLFWKFLYTGILAFLDSFSTTVLSSALPVALSFVFNVIIMLVINRDIRKLGIRTRYVIVSTLLFRQIGVCAFLLYAIYDDYEEILREKQTANNA
jgi:hypothetical protein